MVIMDIMCIIGYSEVVYVKGAPDTVLDRCSYVRVGTDRVPMNSLLKDEISRHIKAYGMGKLFWFLTSSCFQVIHFQVVRIFE